MKRRIMAFSAALVLLLMMYIPVFAETADPVPLKVLIIPKFEIGSMSGDEIGEAQLFYEEYCSGIRETVLPHMPGTAHLYINGDRGVAILVTGSGKNACALALTAVLSDPLLDFSDAFLLSVGCAGGSTGVCTLGDIVVVTGACDNELGHTADSREFDDTATATTWFPDPSYDLTSAAQFSPELSQRVYDLVRDIRPNSTEVSRSVLRANFANAEWAMREPEILKGTALSGDSFWKGETGHNNALKIIANYRMPDPYAVTEMEELTLANTAECYGLLDRVISLRAVVDLDVFLGKDSPESLWDASEGYNNTLGSESSSALDIFEPAMQSLFEVGKTVTDAILSGTLCVN